MIISAMTGPHMIVNDVTWGSDVNDASAVRFASQVALRATRRNYVQRVSYRIWRLVLKQNGYAL